MCLLRISVKYCIVTVSFSNTSIKSSKETHLVGSYLINVGELLSLILTAFNISSVIFCSFIR